MKFKSRFMMVGLTVFMSISLSMTAQADIFGTSQGRADNNVHFVCWVPFASGGGSAPAELNNYLWGYLNGSVYFQTGVYAYPYPCVPLVDAFLDDNLSDPFLYGMTTCRVPLLPGNICVEADVQINKARITADAIQVGISVSAVKQFNWCHETGHSFGLRHTGGSDCLRQGLNTFQTYSSHHIQHLLINL